MKIGIIDIGSNTCKLLIAKRESVSSAIDFVILEQSSLPCRLLSLQADGQNFIEEKQSRLLLQCIGEFMKICKKHAVLKVQAVATEAFRKSSNRQQISLLIEKEFGFEIKILTGQEEARGIAKGLDTDPNIKSFQSYSALDIGGGSVEFIHVKNQKLMEKIMSIVFDFGLEAISIGELVKEVNQDEKELKKILGILISENKIVLIDSKFLFDKRHIELLIDSVKKYFSKNESLDIKSFKELTKTSRKFSVPLLEFLDKSEITYRIGNARKIRK